MLASAAGGVWIIYLSGGCGAGGFGQREGCLFKEHLRSTTQICRYWHDI